MAKSIFESNAILADALRRTKFRIDAASKQNVEIFGKTWYENHFVFGAVPHLMRDFKTILGKMHLTIAASTINGKSAEPLRMNQGFNEFAQKMFTHAHAYKMEADEIRQLILMAEAASKNEEKREVEYIANVLFNQTRAAVQGVRERLDLIILEVLSNHGAFTFSANNDPQSPFIGQTIYFGFDANKKGTVGSDNTWTEAHKATVDPVAEIDAVMKQSRLPLVKILLSRESMLYILSCAKMKGYINSSLYPNMPLTQTILNNWMAENGLPTFEVVEKQSLVQDGDILKPYSPWKAGQLVFLPENQIGTIETAFTDAELGMRSEGVDYQYYGRIETSRYVQGERENADYAEIMKARIIGAPSFEIADNIYTLDTLN